MNAVEALRVLKFELRIKALEDLASEIMNHRDLLEQISYNDPDYDEEQAHSMAASVLEALKSFDVIDTMCLAAFNDHDEVEEWASLDDLAQSADTENTKTRKRITDPRQ